jgi:hypothetical protein
MLQPLDVSCRQISGKVSESATLRLICENRQFQWPRHLGPLPAQILGSWVRISLEALMSVCNSSTLLLFCVSGGLLRQDWSLVQGILPTLYKIHCYSEGKQAGGLMQKAKEEEENMYKEREASGRWLNHRLACDGRHPHLAHALQLCLKAIIIQVPLSIISRKFFPKPVFQ